MAVALSVQYYPLIVLLVFLVMLLVVKSLLLALVASVGAAIVLSTITSREDVNKIKGTTPTKSENKTESKSDNKNIDLDPVSFQQKRDKLHNVNKKEANKEYGGRDLRKDFKKSSDHAFHEV